MSPFLQISDLSIAVGDTPVVSGLSLTIDAGEVHAIMGPNGSGKSTLVSTLAGHPAYAVTGGSVRFMGKDLLAMEPHERAQSGVFLAFQYPKEIAGVSLRSFLHAAYNAQMAVRTPDAVQRSPIKFQKMLAAKMEELSMNPAFADRALNQGFSGGEKKKAEILQLLLLQPLLALLDETDSGLDIDALKIVAEGVNSMRSPQFSALLVTHYVRILDHIRPDHVHVMVRGSIVESGGSELAVQLEREGYKRYGITEAA
jgi:Fe-S cluster assembly ATP-binding protein